MGKITWKGGTFVYPLPAVMVSCGDMKNSNIITAAWTGIINTNPAMCYISVRPERFSSGIIKKNKEFVINLTTKELARATDWCGVKSGRDFDKFKEMGLTKEKATIVKSPMIAESPISVECKVVAINVSDKFVNEKGAFDISKCDLMAYANGGYYPLGKKIGQFGFSVMKKSTKNKKGIR